jgi:hypothetical protein
MDAAEALEFAQRREHLCFKTSLIFASGGMLSFLAMQGAGLWFRWVSRPAAIRAHRMGNRHAMSDFGQQIEASMPFFYGAGSLLLLCAACFAICFIAWLVWMAKRRRLEAKVIGSN